MKIEEIQSFIEKQTWTFAKTYAKKAPHEYKLSITWKGLESPENQE